MKQSLPIENAFAITKFADEEILLKEKKKRRDEFNEKWEGTKKRVPKISFGKAKNQINSS